MKTWQLPVYKRRQWEVHVPSKTEEDLKHTVSTACRPGVFRMAVFKGFPNILNIPPPPPYGTQRGHKYGNNDNNQRKPTELAQNVVIPGDMQCSVSTRVRFGREVGIPPLF